MRIFDLIVIFQLLRLAVLRSLSFLLLHWLHCLLLNDFFQLLWELWVISSFKIWKSFSPFVSHTELKHFGGSVENNQWHQNEVERSFMKQWSNFYHNKMSIILKSLWIIFYRVYYFSLTFAWYINSNHHSNWFGSRNYDLLEESSERQNKQ
jgi:hypothetical protein